jgi:3-keto-disaccharide hydrolase
MRTTFACLIIAGAIAGCQGNSGTQQAETDTTKTDTMAPAPVEITTNTLTEEEKSAGWQLLFDGASKSNFHVFNKKTDGSAWQVADGALHLDTTTRDKGKIVGGGDLLTNEEYDNFDLKIDWKIDPGGNSGIMFYVQEGPSFGETYHTGPEMQVLDNAAHPDAKIIKHRAGDLYDLITSSPETVKPAGEWNQVEVISNKGALEFHLNGTKILSTTMWDDAWKKMIAASKFKQWSGFGTYKKGRIALQDHGNSVWYRNIKIKKL